MRRNGEKGLNKIVPGLAVALLTSISMAGSTIVTGNANDQEWYGAASATAIGNTLNATTAGAHTDVPVIYYKVTVQ